MMAISNDAKCVLADMLASAFPGSEVEIHNMDRGFDVRLYWPEKDYKASTQYTDSQIFDLARRRIPYDSYIVNEFLHAYELAKNPAFNGQGVPVPGLLAAIEEAIAPKETFWDKFFRAANKANGQ